MTCTANLIRLYFLSQQPKVYVFKLKLVFIFYSEIPTTNGQSDSLSGTNSEVTVQLNCYSISAALLEHCSTNQIWGLELMYNAVYTRLIHKQTHV